VRSASLRCCTWNACASAADSASCALSAPSAAPSASSAAPPDVDAGPPAPRSRAPASAASSAAAAAKNPAASFSFCAAYSLTWRPRRARRRVRACPLAAQRQPTSALAWALLGRAALRGRFPSLRRAAGGSGGGARLLLGDHQAPARVGGLRLRAQPRGVLLCAPPPAARQRALGAGPQRAGRSGRARRRPLPPALKRGGGPARAGRPAAGPHGRRAPWSSPKSVLITESSGLPSPRQPASRTSDSAWLASGPPCVPMPEEHWLRVCRIDLNNKTGIELRRCQGPGRTQDPRARCGGGGSAAPHTKLQALGTPPLIGWVSRGL